MEQADEKKQAMIADTEQEKENEVPGGENGNGILRDNRGVGVVEVILILVVIFTIYKGCK